MVRRSVVEAAPVRFEYETAAFAGHEAVLPAMAGSASQALHLRQGLFLFNCFVADDAAVALQLWERCPPPSASGCAVNPDQPFGRQ